MQTPADRHVLLGNYLVLHARRLRSRPGAVVSEGKARHFTSTIPPDELAGKYETTFHHARHVHHHGASSCHSKPCLPEEARNRHARNDVTGRPRSASETPPNTFLDFYLSYGLSLLRTFHIKISNVSNYIENGYECKTGSRSTPWPRHVIK